MEERYEDGCIFFEGEFGAKLLEVGNDCVNGFVGGREEGELHEDLNILIGNVHPTVELLLYTFDSIVPLETTSNRLERGQAKNLDDIFGVWGLVLYV